jgi:4-hydroxyphenylacetate 3-monooxygenase oxygenase component
MAARSGAQYLEGLRDGREVWYSGERVSDVTTHPVFAAGAQSIARLYDLQHAPEYSDILTYPSPKTGARVGISFLMPRREEELVQRRTMMEVWAAASCGMLAQSPDYMNIGIMSLAAAHDVLAKADPRFGVHALRYYEICREQDRCLARLVPTAWPQTPMASASLTDTLPSLQVVAQTSAGLIARGACMLATFAPFADDLVVYGGTALQPGEGARALVCAVPMASPGVSLVCRESAGQMGSHFDHPLASRFEVMDCIVLFDNVLIPWERVFLHSNVELYNRLESSVRFFWQVGHQVVTRQIAKTILLLGIAHLLSETSGLAGLLHMQEKLGEIVTYLETLRSCLRRAEVDAVMGANGVLYPQGDAIHAALRLFPMVYPRLIEILQLLGAGGYMMMPSAGDLASPLAGAITQCYQGATGSATTRMQLFRLAWDIVGESFGARQQLYERYSAGDPAHMMAARYLDYDKTAAVERVHTLLEIVHQP